jgi:HAD superfamily hydrolase (TIGR01509 family)
VTDANLARILRPAEAVLFDFDGPVCSVFDGYPAQQITEELRKLARDVRGDLSPALIGASSPHDLLLAAAGDRDLAGLLEDALQKAEMSAVQTALPTPGAAESLAACSDSGRIVAVVSNNYAGAVVDYLTRLGLADLVKYIEGRNASDPALMKPNPYLLERTVRAVEVQPTSSVFIGDQTTDIEAGRAAGTPTIGYANKPGKTDSLSAAGADVVIETMVSVADAIR